MKKKKEKAKVPNSHVVRDDQTGGSKGRWVWFRSLNCRKSVIEKFAQKIPTEEEKKKS